MVLADGKPVLRDLACVGSKERLSSKTMAWMIPLREEKLNSEGLGNWMWDEKAFHWNCTIGNVLRFKEKEGRWPRQNKAEDKREVVLADGKPVLRDLAQWMHNQKRDKGNGKLIPLREEMLNEIGFPFHNRTSATGRLHPVVPPASPRKKRTISDYL